MVTIERKTELNIKSLPEEVTRNLDFHLMEQGEDVEEKRTAALSRIEVLLNRLRRVDSFGGRLLNQALKTAGQQQEVFLAEGQQWKRQKQTGLSDMKALVSLPLGEGFSWLIRFDNLDPEAIIEKPTDSGLTHYLVGEGKPALELKPGGYFFSLGALAPGKEQSIIVSDSGQLAHLTKINEILPKSKEREEGWDFDVLSFVSNGVDRRFSFIGWNREKIGESIMVEAKRGERIGLPGQTREVLKVSQNSSGLNLGPFEVKVDDFLTGVVIKRGEEYLWRLKIESGFEESPLSTSFLSLENYLGYSEDTYVNFLLEKTAEVLWQSFPKIKLLIEK